MEPSTDKPSSNRTKRYTQEEKNEILQFIESHNAANRGRGGQVAAATKFNVSQITVSQWVKKKEKGPKVKDSKVKRENKKDGFYTNNLSQLLAMGKEIDHLQKQLDEKIKQFKILKSKI